MGVDGAGAENGVRALVVGVEAVLGHPVLGANAAEEHLEAYKGRLAAFL